MRVCETHEVYTYMWYKGPHEVNLDKGDTDVLCAIFIFATILKV